MKLDYDIQGEVNHHEDYSGNQGLKLLLRKMLFKMAKSTSVLMNM